ncbi:MAG: T9SS type A sorting domain-containing protein, partial [Calditrichaeota bacterium]|nr:T9SS type A sorting domain-containing protein [Calditrichota bacterium]
VNGYLQPGFHYTILNAADLPSGLYFVRLKASDKVFTQKVMLIR